MQKPLTFRSQRWGEVHVRLGSYVDEDGPLAVMLTSADGELIAKLSANMYRPECSEDSRDLPADCFYVKQWGENEAIAQEALASALFIERPDLPVAESGFVTAPVWQLRSPA
jgi:hypothetical protein